MKIDWGRQLTIDCNTHETTLLTVSQFLKLQHSSSITFGLFILDWQFKPQQKANYTEVLKKNYSNDSNIVMIVVSEKPYKSLHRPTILAFLGLIGPTQV